MSSAIAFALLVRANEVAGKQVQPARLSQFHDANECLAAGETLPALIQADQMPTGLVANAASDVGRTQSRTA